MSLTIEIQKATLSKVKDFDFKNVQFGKSFTDHMFIAEYSNGEWHNPRIQPYGPIPMSPALSAIHYGQSIFEGMKAYKDPNGFPLIFRPKLNWERLNKSAHRMCMPAVPEELFMDGLRSLVEIDEAWIPTIEGAGLYLRPFLFATDDFIGVKPASNFLFIIFACPVNAYYTKPLQVKVAEHYVRSWDGGAGFAKAAGNYGISMLPTKEAQLEGFDQIVWMDGREHQYIEESGTTNLFFVIGNSVITPELDGNILDGVTRKSCIELLRENGHTVEERKISITEVHQAYQQGTLKEAFATGTAATVVQIARISYQGEDILFPNTDEKRISNWLGKTLENIKTGKVPDTYNWNWKLN